MLKYTPYSYSKLSTFDCPYKFKLNYIDKIKVFTENKALEKGTRIHQIIELYNPYSKTLPLFEYKLLDENEQKECEQLALDFIDSELGQSYLLNDGAIGHEIEFGLTTKLLPCNYYNKNAMLRGKIDFFIKEGNVGTVVDWKSGKVKDQAYMSNDQVILYAIWVFNTFADIDTVKADYVYVEHGERHRFEFSRNNYNNYSQLYAQKIKKIESETEFNKNPTRLCDWCDYKGKHCNPQ